MRKVIVTALALFPMLLHAQANTPAKTQSSGAASTLQAELGRPKEFSAAVDTTRSVTPAATPLRVSTGVVAPKLLSTVDIPSDGINAIPGIRKTYVVEMTVDKNGEPSNVKIVESTGPTLDKNVLDAVRQYRFKPGTLDHQPIDFPVSLALEVKNPTL
jgi:TonB family protein